MQVSQKLVGEAEDLTIWRCACRWYIYIGLGATPLMARAYSWLCVRNHSWWAQGIIWNVRIKPGSATWMCPAHWSNSLAPGNEFSVFSVHLLPELCRQLLKHYWTLFPSLPSTSLQPEPHVLPYTAACSCATTLFRSLEDSQISFMFKSSSFSRLLVSLSLAFQCIDL